MSIWDKISNATRIPRPGGGGGPPQGGGGTARRGQHWIMPWLAIAVVVVLIWIVYSGLAQQWMDEFEQRLLALLQPFALVLVLVALIAFLAGWALMKMPKGHFLADHGRRLIWVSPMALVVGAAIVPVALIVLTLTQNGAAQLTANYLGQKPAASFCAATQAAAPATVPAPHR